MEWTHIPGIDESTTLFRPEDILMHLEISPQNGVYCRGGPRVQPQFSDYPNPLPWP